MSDKPNPTQPPQSIPKAEHLPGATVRLIALAVLTAVGVVLCVLIAYPFLPALAWGMALAIMAWPFQRQLEKVIPKGNWSAGISTFAVLVVIVVPIIWTGIELARQAESSSEQMKSFAQGGWREITNQLPLPDDWEEKVDIEGQTREFIQSFTMKTRQILEGSFWGILQLLIMLLVLFFALKDHDHLLERLRHLLPVTDSEADYLFTRTSDAIYASVYATLVTGLIQAVVFGLIFAYLGIPAPLLWATIIFILGILPVLGAFIVWIPIAVGLALNEQWGATLGIVAAGLILAGPVANFVYALIAGGRLRLHPMPALLAFVGGLVVFGLSGMVIGPVVLAVTIALIDMWRTRSLDANNPKR